MIWFDRRMAVDLDATVELRVRLLARRRPLRLTVRFADGSVRVWPRAPAAPVATATIGAPDLLRLAAGRVRWPQLLSTGRLELSGDPFGVLRRPTLFRLRAGG